MADALGEPLTAVVLGSDIEKIAGDLKTVGADTIVVGDDPALAEYTTDIFTNVLVDIMKVTSFFRVFVNVSNFNPKGTD